MKTRQEILDRVNKKTTKTDDMKFARGCKVIHKATDKMYSQKVKRIRVNFREDAPMRDLIEYSKKLGFKLELSGHNWYLTV